MKLHPQALAIVKKLIAQGRAGARPFCVPLEVWRQEIARQDANRWTREGEASDQPSQPEEH